MTARIDPQAIKEKLTTETLGRSVVFREETASTNADAKALGRQGAPHGTLVLCARQTAGRGRRGRSWLSDEGALCMTLLLRPPFPPELAPRYIVACALGVCRALRACGASARIKWPNDILANGRKLCGILLEADASGFVAAGIGVNVNQRDFPADIAGTAGSLLTATGRAHDPNDVIARILAECEPLFAACGDEAGYAALLESYQALSLTIGRRVRVFAPGEEYDAKAVGLDPLGMLIVQRDGGETRVVGAGDVTIRGAIGN
ncbi:MAG TPA: biotin--[acetyl-CoA-carboxylase] ligase [Clostridia bacterium]|nr:biotin--[acetyl-CoA-carboxylase] ligase [Clostridia bacterium]HPK14486.1 biotin--[acetyl-CoA-carboxylase] ligase [Clostridia bacterium]